MLAFVGKARRLMALRAPRVKRYLPLPPPEGVGLTGCAAGRLTVSTTWVVGFCWACLTVVNSPVFALRPIFMIEFLSAIGVKFRADLKPDQIVANLTLSEVSSTICPYPAR